MLRDPHDAARAMWDYFEANPSREFAGTRLIAIAPADYPVIQTASKPIRTMADMSGVKLRSAGRYGAKVLEALGALPIQMPAGELTDSLTRGVIDGAFLPWSAVSLLEPNDLMQHFTEFADDQDKMHTSVRMVVLSQATHDRLPDDMKKVLDDSSGAEVSPNSRTPLPARSQSRSKPPAPRAATSISFRPRNTSAGRRPRH